MSHKLDILAFGAHPDDVEIGAAGTLIKHKNKGKRIGICDLTYAELSSNGTVEIRQQEAKKASEIMGLHVRENLGFPDRGLSVCDSFIKRMVDVIRRYRPAVVLAPYWEDRHPDHEHASRMVREAVFSAGIRRYEGGEDLPHHYVNDVYYYFINRHVRPRFTVDVSGVYEQKTAALSAYQSQFKMSGTEVQKTVLNQGYLEVVEARDRQFGQEHGCEYAEGFVSEKPFAVDYIL